RPPEASATSQTVKIISTADGGGNDLLAGQTFNQVSTALSAGDWSFDIPLDISAIGTSTDFPVTAVVTPGARTVSLISGAVSPFVSAPAPLSGLTVEVMILAQWQDDDVDI